MHMHVRMQLGGAVNVLAHRLLHHRAHIPSVSLSNALRTLCSRIASVTTISL